MLLDLEFSQTTLDAGWPHSYHAGYAVAALALEAWAWQLNNPPVKPMSGATSYPNQNLLLEDVKNKLLEGERKAGRKPRVLIIGALGRCGTAAVDLCKQAGIPDENILQCDLPETRAKPGLYEEIPTSTSSSTACTFRTRCHHSPITSHSHRQTASSLSFVMSAAILRTRTIQYPYTRRTAPSTSLCYLSK